MSGKFESDAIWGGIGLSMALVAAIQTLSGHHECLSGDLIAMAARNFFLTFLGVLAFAGVIRILTKR